MRDKTFFYRFLAAGFLIAALLGGWFIFSLFLQKQEDEIEAKKDLIVVQSVKPHQEIISPMIVEGMARGLWFFEASFPIRVFDAEGELLGVAVAQAQGEWMTKEFVPFRAYVDFRPSKSKEGVMVFEKDNPSGLPENADELRIPITFRRIADKTDTDKKDTEKADGSFIILNVYFNNTKFDPEFSCEKVFAVERNVPLTKAVAKAALEELLKGVGEEERVKGFSTSINSGVMIKSIAIKEGIMRVDFSEELEKGVGGSCRVQAIRAQITKTLTQFPTVREVIVSINGRTEDILQP